MYFFDGVFVYFHFCFVVLFYFFGVRLFHIFVITAESSLERHIDICQWLVVGDVMLHVHSKGRFLLVSSH